MGILQPWLWGLLFVQLFIPRICGERTAWTCLQTEEARSSVRFRAPAGGEDVELPFPPPLPIGPPVARSYPSGKVGGSREEGGTVTRCPAVTAGSHGNGGWFGRSVPCRRWCLLHNICGDGWRLESDLFRTCIVGGTGLRAFSAFWVVAISLLTAALGWP